MNQANAQGRIVKTVAVLFFCFLFVGCRKADPEAQRQAAIKLTAETMRRCLPQVNADSNASLAIVAAARERDAEATVLRMVVYATTQPIEFDLPLYYMSRGRWTINDTGRAYLLDENCREYKLKDTHATVEANLPRDGKVKLQPGNSYEFRLRFPKLPDETQSGVLVYAGRVLPFSLLVEAR